MVHLVIRDYLKAGDSVTKDAVGLKISMGTFTDGTICTEKIHLDVAAQNLAVAIENSGYKKLGGRGVAAPGGFQTPTIPCLIAKWTNSAVLCRFSASMIRYLWNSTVRVERSSSTAMSLAE